MNKKNLRVLFDHQIFSLQRVGGISRYYAELLKNLPKSDCTPLLPDLYTDNLYVKEPRSLPIKINHPKIRGRLNEFASRFNSRKLLKNETYDIFHPTYYSTYHLGRSKSPFVITVYDMIHELYPEQFRNNEIQRNKKKLLRAADTIISISHHTKQDILKFIDINPDKIKVIHLAASMQGSVPKAVDLAPKKFILFVGERKGYKNFKSLAEAFAGIKDKVSDVNLFCAGGGPFNADETKLISDLKIGDRIYQQGVSDSELAWAYKQAECFVFPSLYEGFGIPILESMGSGTPTILSDRSCFPEIAKQAALYFKSVDDLKDILLEVLIYKVNVANYRALGLKLAGEYSWEKVAAETANVYQGLVK